MNFKNIRETIVTMVKKHKIIAIAAAVLIAILLLQGLFMSFASSFQSNDPNRISLGRTYVLKSIDGSGNVPWYGDSSASSPSGTVPDGTEVIAKEYAFTPMKVSVEYQGKIIYVERDNFAGETGTSIETRELALKESKQKGFLLDLLRMLPLITAVIICILFTKIIKRNYASYYALKRAEFPWLENWINQNRDPEPLRVKSAVKTVRIIIIVAAVAGLLGGGLLARIIRSFVKYEGIFDNNAVIAAIINAIFLGIGIVITLPMTRHSLMKFSGVNGLGLECPICGCPHAWGLTASNVIVKKMESNKETHTTTTTTETKWKGTPDFINYAASGFKNDGIKTKTKEKNIKNIWIEGIDIYDFLCDNCKHTQHTEEERQHTSLYTVALADSFYFDEKSAFRMGGASTNFADSWESQHKLAKWSKDFLECVKANAVSAGINASAITGLARRTADYTRTYKDMEYLDAEIEGEYYKSCVRELVYSYLKDLPDDKRALFGMLPKWTLYAWMPPVEDEKKEENKSQN